MGGGAGGCCPEEHRPTSLHLQQVGRDSPKHVARLGPGCLGSSAWVGSFSPRTSWGTQLALTAWVSKPLWEGGCSLDGHSRRGCSRSGCPPRLDDLQAFPKGIPWRKEH